MFFVFDVNLLFYIFCVIVVVLCPCVENALVCNNRLIK